MLTDSARLKWEFPKTRGTLFGGPYSKDPTISGTILGSPIFGNSQIGVRRDCEDEIRHSLGAVKVGLRL